MTDSAPLSLQILRAGDSDRMRALSDCFAEAFDDEESYRSAPPGDDYLDALLQSEYFIAIVAIAGDEVVGGLTAYELCKREQERSELYIYDLAVLEAFRRRGIATALVGELRHVAKSRDAWVVFVQADLDDAPTVALYTKLGSREDVLHFDIPVE